MKLREYFVRKENKNNEFIQQYILFQSVFATIHKNEGLMGCEQHEGE